MAHSDIRRFVNIIGRRIDSPEIAEFLRTWGTHTKVGEIRVHKEGFDVILASKEEWGGSRGTGTSKVWACYMRFFSPEYCVGKKIKPYRGPIIDDVCLPLTRQGVLERFGTPSKSLRNGQHSDEYDFADCVVRFVYPNTKEHVAFVELDRCRVAAEA
jgi:hypothetical protein